MPLPRVQAVERRQGARPAPEPGIVPRPCQGDEKLAVWPSVDTDVMHAARAHGSRQMSSTAGVFIAAAVTKRTIGLRFGSLRASSPAR
jgi:hypothetical protein